MEFKITGVKTKEMPSKFGGTWKIVQVKVEGRDEIFELSGFGDKMLEKVKAGDTVKGYENVKDWGKGKTNQICKITAEYVYDLLMKMQSPTVAAASNLDAALENEVDSWNIPPATSSEVTPDDTNW